MAIEINERNKLVKNKNMMANGSGLNFSFKSINKNFAPGVPSKNEPVLKPATT